MNFGLTELFQCFKKLAAGVETKTFKKIDGHSELTLSVASTNRSNTKRILVFGDSNSFRPDGAEKSWPSILQNKNRSYLRVFNESCDGRTIGHDTGQYNGIAHILHRLNAYKSLDYIIFMLGTNDLKIKYGPATPQKIIRDMRNLIIAVASHGGDIKPILLTPPPMGVVTSGQLANAHSRVKQLAAEYRKLAFELGIPLVDIYSNLHITTDLEDDMIHINSKGRRKIADAVWSEIFIQSTPQA